MKERKLSIREIIVLIAVILLISATACRASKADQTKIKVKEIKIGTMDLVNPDLVARKKNIMKNIRDQSKDREI